MSPLFERHVPSHLLPLLDEMRSRAVFSATGEWGSLTAALPELTKMAGCSPRQARRRRDELVRLGLVQITRRGGRDQHARTVYLVHR